MECLRDWTGFGLGDFAFNWRFLAMLRERGVERVVVEVPDKMMPLARAQQLADVEPVEPGKLPATEHQIYMVATPAMLDWRPVRQTGPTWSALTDRVEYWRSRRPVGRRVALAWTSRLTQFPLRRVEQVLASSPGVQWISVERGLKPEDAKRLADTYGVVHIGDDVEGSMVELAAALSACDAGILVDSTAAHIAASVGLPVTVVLNRQAPAAAYRWFHWYPANVVRPRGGKDWRDVVDNVVAELSSTRG